MKVVPSLSFLSWWSVIREGSCTLGGGGLLSHFRCHFVSWGSFAGFAQSSSSFVTDRCVLVRLCPMCSSLFRCLARFEMAGWRNRVVVLPSHSSALLCFSSSSSSRGKPASAVVAQTFWSGMRCCWVSRVWSSSVVRITSPSVGNLGSVVFRAIP